MRRSFVMFLLASGGILLFSSAHAVGARSAVPLTMAQIIAASTPSDWRPVDPQRTLYMQLDTGRVIIELAPDFAPRHVTNILALVREHYFDGLAFLRAQDNYVVQWGDPDGKREVHGAARTLPAEFTRSAQGLPFTPLPDPDTYAAQTGFADGFAAARESANGRAWLTHCYGAVGAGRDTDANSGGGTELYVVIGHAPRHLDRNVTLVGRVVKGMELLSTLRRGTGNLGFYETAAERTPIRSIRVAADLPESERTPLEELRTDTGTFAALVEARRDRSDEWFKFQAGRVDVCNVPVVVRTPPARN
jgi:cyclophilin family peptidyl-prolyl cis-trans isomerase